MARSGKKAASGVKNRTCGSRTCKPNSVCRIAPAGRPFLWATHYCAAQATYPEVVTRRAGTCGTEAPDPSLFGLAPCRVCPARGITDAAVRSYRTFSPLPRRSGRPSSARRNLTRTAGRYIFCGTFRRTGLNPPSRTLSGTLLCGVRTFLCLATATVRPSCQQLHYSAGRSCQRRCMDGWAALLLLGREEERIQQQGQANQQWNQSGQVNRLVAYNPAQKHHDTDADGGRNQAA